MKMSCEATCAKCYLAGGRRQEFPDPNAKVWFCQNCRKVFFCEIGLGRGFDYSGNTVYSCPHCSTSLGKEEIDKILIAKGGAPAKSTESQDVYQKTMKGRWSESSSSDVSVTTAAKISELSDFKGLTIPLLKNIAQNHKIQNKTLDKLEKRATSSRDFLTGLGGQSPELIAFLFSVLKRQESLSHSLQTRFAVFCAEDMAQKFHAIEIAPFSGNPTYNLRLIDSDSKEIWVYTLDENVDVDNLESYVQRVLQTDFLDYPFVREIFLVARSFSFMAKGMLKKYQSAISGAHDHHQTFSLPIVLWQPIPNRFGFQAAPVE